MYVASLLSGLSAICSQRIIEVSKGKHWVKDLSTGYVERGSTAAVWSSKTKYVDTWPAGMVSRAHSVSLTAGACDHLTCAVRGTQRCSDWKEMDNNCIS